MQLFVTWIMECFSNASHAITLGPWDLADRTERGIKISKILHLFAWLSFDFLFRDFGPSYLLHFFCRSYSLFPVWCHFMMGGVLTSPPHLLAFSSIKGNFHKSVSFANLWGAP